MFRVVIGRPLKETRREKEEHLQKLESLFATRWSGGKVKGSSDVNSFTMALNPKALMDKETGTVKAFKSNYTTMYQGQVHCPPCVPGAGTLPPLVSRRHCGLPRRHAHTLSLRVLSLSLSHCAPHCVSLSLSLSLPLCLPLSLSLTVPPTVSLSLTVSPTVCLSLTVSPTVSLSLTVFPTVSPSLSPSLSLTVSPTVCLSLTVSPTVSPSLSLSLTVPPTVSPAGAQVAAGRPGCGAPRRPSSDHRRRRASLLPPQQHGGCHRAGVAHRRAQGAGGDQRDAAAEPHERTAPGARAAGKTQRETQ